MSYGSIIGLLFRMVVFLCLMWWLVPDAREYLEYLKIGMIFIIVG